MDLISLWNFVQGLTPAAPVAPAEVQIALAPYAEKLVHLLKFKVSAGVCGQVLRSGCGCRDPSPRH